MNSLTSLEKSILNTLSKAWNDFNSLPSFTKAKWEKSEFMNAIHVAQNIILARPTLRELNEEERKNENR